MGSKQQKCFDLFIQNDKKGQTNNEKSTHNYAGARTAWTCNISGYDTAL